MSVFTFWIFRYQICVDCFIKLSNSIEYQWNTDDFRCNVDHFYTEIFCFVYRVEVWPNQRPTTEHARVFECMCVCVCARQNIDMRQTSKHLFWCFFLSPIATICSPLQLLRYCCYCYCHCCYCYYYHYFLFVKKKVSSPRV